MNVVICEGSTTSQIEQFENHKREIKEGKKKDILLNFNLKFIYIYIYIYIIKMHVCDNTFCPMHQRNDNRTYGRINLEISPNLRFYNFKLKDQSI